MTFFIWRRSADDWEIFDAEDGTEATFFLRVEWLHLQIFLSAYLLASSDRRSWLIGGGGGSTGVDPPGSRVGTSIAVVVWHLWRFGWQINRAV